MRKLWKRALAATLAVIMALPMTAILAGAEEIYDENAAYEEPAVPERVIISRNGVTYTNVASAMNDAQDQDTLRLEADVFLAYPVHIRPGWNAQVTLDLNGHTIRLYDPAENAAEDNSGTDRTEYEGGLLVLDSGTLTIKDSSDYKEGKISSTNQQQPAVLLVRDDSAGTHLNIQGGNFETTTYQPIIGFKDAYGNPLPDYDIRTDDPVLSVSVSDGRFNKQLPANILAPGHVLQDMYDGTWSVAEVNMYAVTWQNWDYTWLEVDNVAEGETPVYYGETPYRYEDEDYTYEFAGWDQPVGPVYSDITYTAVYNQTAKIHYYNVTWQNWDGTWLYGTTVAEGETPVYYGETPVRYEDEEYTYEFAGWDTPDGPVYADTTYTALYDPIRKIITHEITWENWDESVLETDEVVDGEVPQYTGDEPIREEDDLYIYTFSGWDREIEPAGEDAVYVAAFDAEQKEEPTTEEPTTEEPTTEEPTTEEPTTEEPTTETPTEPVPEPTTEEPTTETPTEPVPEPTTEEPTTEEPTEEPTEDPTAEPFTEEPTEPPTEEPTSEEPTSEAPIEDLVKITWLNWDGETILLEEEIEKGMTPEYTGEEPIRESDETYDYTFAGWDPEVAEVSEDTAYVAQFDAQLITYTITWVNWDGVWLETDEVTPDTVPAYIGVAPTRPADEQYTYEFIGWEPAVAAATADATYTAIYKPSARPVQAQYTVVWQNYDSTVLQTDIVKEGEAAEYHGETPWRGADDKYTYVFAGWNPQPGSVYSDTVYTATFHAVEKPDTSKYVIVWQNYDYTVLEKDIVTAGDYPIYYGYTPRRPADNWYRYEFAGWNKLVVPANGDAVYTAVYIAIPKEQTYTITWQNYDHTVLYTSEVRAGWTPQYYGAVPTRASDGQFSYVFAGWTPSVVRAAYDTVYTAVYNAVPIITQYNIIWQNYDGALLKRDTVNNGELPVYTGPAPARASDGRYTYEFIGWNKEITAAEGDTVYVAQFKAVPYFDRGSIDVYTLKAEAHETNYPVLYERDVTEIPYVELSKAFAKLNGLYNDALLDTSASFTSTYHKDGQSLILTVERENGARAIINLAENTVTFTDYTGFSAYQLAPEGEEVRLLKEVNSNTNYPTRETEVVVDLDQYDLHVYAIDGAGYMPLATFSDLFLVPAGFNWIYDGTDSFIVTDRPLPAAPGSDAPSDPRAADDGTAGAVAVNGADSTDGAVDAAMVGAAADSTDGAVDAGMVGAAADSADGAADAGTVASGQHESEKKSGAELLAELLARIAGTSETSEEASGSQADVTSDVAVNDIQSVAAAGGTTDPAAVTANEIQNTAAANATARNITPRTNREAAFAYSELCLLLDLNYGMKKDLGVKEGFDAFFREVGLYQSLVSTNPEVYRDALKELSEVYFVNAPAAEQPNSYEEVGGTAYVTITDFSSKGLDYADAAIREHLDEYLADDVIALTAYARAQITRENSPVENIVIDLSEAAGSDLRSAAFVMSWVLASADLNMEDVLSELHEAVAYQADVDLDGRITPADRVDLNRYNVFCLISSNTRDYANLTASVFKASDKVTIVGQTTGGGAYNLLTAIDSDGNQLRFAGLRRYCTFKAGAYISIAGGVDADVYLKDISVFENRYKLEGILDDIR